MLPSRGLVAAVLLLSVVQAGVPRVRLAARGVDTTTTPEPATTTTRFLLPFESTTTASTETDVSSNSVTSADESTKSTTEVESTTAESTDTTDASTTTEASVTTDTSATTDVSASTEVSATTAASTTTDASVTTDASTTEASVTTDTSVTADASTTAEATLPTNFVSTGTGAFVGVSTAATNAASSFSDLAAAASSIAANPSPSAEEVKQFQQRAQEEFDELERIEAQLQKIDLNSLSEDDSHKVEAALVGLAALLGWFSTQLTALAPAVATPALGPAIFADLAPAFGAAAAGGLLADALDGLEDLGNEDDKTDEKSDEESTEQSTEQESTTEESTSTTTSPCTDDTAEHVTIICKPATITEDGNVQTTETCYESITVEVTGCSVTEATTVVSTTGTAAAITPCASGTCGGGADCPVGELPLSGADMAFVSTKVDCADVSTITTSELPTGPGAFGDNPVAEPTPRAESDGSAAEKRDLSPRVFTDNTTPNRNYVASLTPTWVSQVGNASGHWFNYPETGQASAGVNGIYGCTAVIITSDKGVYLSHIWENPVFIDNSWNPTDDASFNTRAFEALRDGTPNALSVTTLVGDDADPGPLHARNSPQIYVLTPFTTPNDPTGITTLYRYQDRAQQLANNLAGVIPGSSSHLVGYTRTNGQLSTQEPGYLGRAILEVDLFQEIILTKDSSGRSWAYPIGRWRLWVEDTLVTYRNFLSDGPDDLGNLGEGEGQQQKRQESEVNECLLVSRASSTSEATSTATESITTKSTETTQTTEPTQSTETTETTATGESTATTEESTASTSTEESTATTKDTTTNESTATSSTEEATSTAESTATTDATTSAISSTATTFSTATISSRSTSEESSATTVSTESEESTSSTRTKPNIRTITSDGMICTLIEGSLHPVCRPISTPTPNPDGTNIHVNKGCILINNSPRCASDAGDISNVYESSYKVASDPNEPYSTVLILSGFDSSVDNHLHSKATCQLQARWPADYGDIYYGENGCLYDSQSNKIFDQCCSPPDINNSGPATNPYAPPAPPDAKQDRGNHDGSAICASISKDTCLWAAARYVDDIVYHQYTSAVWPDDTGKDIANAIFPIVGPIVEDFFGINYGCTVIWTCDNDDAFSQGMTGKQIKDSMLNIYNLNGAKGCGSTYLDNGCHITVNGCNNCHDAGHSQTIWSPYDVYKGTFDDANNGFPPRR